MTTQRALHSNARRHLSELEQLIDKLKAIGPCQLDGDNALLNVKELLLSLVHRC